jgi:2-(1,2-epoxy-1,2-dihydrophenyl)acetyl-CoA isomerase
MTAPVLLEFDGPIATLKLNRPEVLNAADAALALAFRDACFALEGDTSVRVVVLSGEGRAFMAGGDIARFRESPHAIAKTLIDPLHEGVQCLVRMRAPVIASLHGAVAGAGLSLAMACDLAIAAEGTRFSFAYAKLGASCDLGGSWHLPRQVGLRRALEIALLGETFDAAQALQLGLLNRVVPAAALADETRQLAERLAAGAPLALGQLKRLMRDSSSRDLPEQLAAERAAFAASVETNDFQEGVAAFLARRAPGYEGR